MEVWALHTAQVALGVAQFCEARRLARARSHFSCWRTLPAVNRAEVLRNDMSHAMARSVQSRRLGQILGSWRPCAGERRHKRICNIVRAHSERGTSKILLPLGRRRTRARLRQGGLPGFAYAKPVASLPPGWPLWHAGLRRGGPERCCRRLDRIRLRQCLRKWRRRVEVSCSQRRAAKMVRDRVDALSSLPPSTPGSILSRPGSAGVEKLEEVRQGAHCENLCRVAHCHRPRGPLP